ncbi:MAG: DUF3187 family protein [Planctomycetes bacterium]|nr:DUF3187 family protein [Planctomycetota bacterium]
MTGYAWVLLAAVALGDGSSFDAWQPEPIAARNQHPLSLLFLDLPVASAATIPEVHFEAALHATYSSISQSGFGTHDQAVFDGEFARAAATLRWGAADALELSVEVPIAYASGGFLDHFINEYHRALGLPQTVPEGIPNDFFEVRAARNGHEYFSVEPHDVSLGDVDLATKVRLLSEERAPLTLAVRAGIEPPTGSVSRGFGSDTWDAAVGVIAQRSFGDWTAFLDADVSIPDLFDQFGGPRPQPFLSISPALRVELAAWVGLVAELDFNTNVIPNSDVPELNRNQLQIDAGAEFRITQQTSLEVGFGEDLFKKTSPDVTGIAGIRVRF